MFGKHYLFSFKQNANFVNILNTNSIGYTFPKLPFPSTLTNVNWSMVTLDLDTDNSSNFIKKILINLI